MTESDPSESRPAYSEDKLLRREAGEDWHPGGLNRPLLDAIVVREKIMDAIIAENPRDDREELLTEYEFQLERIRELKREHGIGQPPTPIDIPPEA